MRLLLRSKLSLALLGYLLAAVTLTACMQQPPGSGASTLDPAAVDAWDEHVEAFIEDFFEAHPSFAVTAGRHDFDGRLPDWSPTGLQSAIDQLKTAKRGALAFSEEDLNEEQRFERSYLLAVIDRNLFWLETAEWPQRNPQFYFDWILDSLDPNVYVARPYASAIERMRAYIDYAKALPKAAAQIRANLRVPMPRSYIDVGSASFGGLATYFESDLPLAFAEIEDPELQSAFAEANRLAVDAMRELSAWLEKQRATANDDYALGAELFSEMLRATERVDKPLKELEALGRRDLERNLAALEQACGEYAQGETIASCIQRVASNKPVGGAVQGARAQLSGLKELLIEEDLVSIPGTEEALVAEAPPHNRSNFAYIDIPGPYERGLPSTYYIAPPDPSWPREEQLAYVPGAADLLFTSVHEVWPGHFLQFLHANRSPSRIGRLYVGYAFAEGWAHYSEELMWEAGLGGGNPGTHIGQLVNALLRNVRFLSAIGLHTQGMTLEESERMFLEQAYQDPGNARQQAARGTYDPAYLNYTLGKLMIRQLRHDWTKDRGGREAWKDFHDTFLSFGGPPIPLLRARMLGEGSGPPL